MRRCREDEGGNWGNQRWEGRSFKRKEWGAFQIEINPHSCVSISKFELSKKGKGDKDLELFNAQVLRPWVTYFIILTSIVSTNDDTFTIKKGPGFEEKLKQ